MRLIDLDALPYGRVEWEDIVESPTVDAVPVVRCKDCIRWRQSKSDTTAKVCDWDGFEKTENDFCSWAKRREDDTR